MYWLGYRKRQIRNTKIDSIPVYCKLIFRGEPHSAVRADVGFSRMGGLVDIQFRLGGKLLAAKMACIFFLVTFTIQVRWAKHVSFKMTLLKKIVFVQPYQYQSIQRSRKIWCRSRSRSLLKKWSRSRSDPQAYQKYDLRSWFRSRSRSRSLVSVVPYYTHLRGKLTWTTFRLHYTFLLQKWLSSVTS